MKVEFQAINIVFFGIIGYARANIALNTKFDLVSRGRKLCSNTHTKTSDQYHIFRSTATDMRDYRQFSPRHWHDHIEIIYVVSGSLQVVCGENEYTLQENEFLS